MCPTSHCSTGRPIIPAAPVSLSVSWISGLSGSLWCMGSFLLLPCLSFFPLYRSLFAHSSSSLSQFLSLYTLSSFLPLLLCTFILLLSFPLPLISPPNYLRDLLISVYVAACFRWMATLFWIYCFSDSFRRAFFLSPSKPECLSLVYPLSVLSLTIYTWHWYLKISCSLCHISWKIICCFQLWLHLSTMPTFLLDSTINFVFSYFLTSLYTRIFFLLLFFL